MTGFGRSEYETPEVTISVEIRALNSKNLELNLRIPYNYRVWEEEVRAAVKPQLLRGKVDINLHIKHHGLAAASELNKEVITAYIQQLGEIAHATPAELLPIATRLPDALQSAETSPDEKQKKEVFALVNEAIENLDNYQKTEGQAMATDLSNQIENIGQGLHDVDTKKGKRLEQVRSKLQENLKALAIDVDSNRFEQELIFYLEKLDINEEIVRLGQHLSYFREVMENDAIAKGKKLGFIAQEMGREINTIGSKANDAAMQKEIVRMKDALERIKEQLLNVL
jgi:uncharacterized protein (TIGR00255 family)